MNLLEKIKFKLSKEKIKRLERKVIVQDNEYSKILRFVNNKIAFTKETIYKEAIHEYLPNGAMTTTIPLNRQAEYAAFAYIKEVTVTSCDKKIKFSDFKHYLSHMYFELQKDRPHDADCFYEVYQETLKI